MTVINKLLVANRGEIAVRIIKTCKKYGIETVAVFSEVDKNAQHTKLADSAYLLGPGPSHESYLRADKIIEIAKQAKVDAIHPGYGFLSENAGFAKLCLDNSIIWIGPTPATISAMGSKIGAKKLLKDNKKVPLIPGSTSAIESAEQIKQLAEQIGTPILLKASAGGGGKGMRIVTDLHDLASAIQQAQSEAQSSFGDSSLLLEKYFTNVKHIEVQIIGDQYGNIYHLNERECSVQRRHQKVIEEAPSTSISEKVRQTLLEAAIAVGQTIGYQSLGTVEFIYDVTTEEIFFLEVNTRLQVEHPVTEMTHGLDVVLLQIRIAEGVSLPTLGISGDITPHGHAIECRLCAEDPTNQFFPCTGKIIEWRPALQGEHVRFDSSIVSGTEISVFYDPLIAKIICWGENRQQANQLLQHTLRNTVVLGIPTNKQFLLDVLQHESFIDQSFCTNFIDTHLSSSSRKEIYHQHLETHRNIIAIAAMVREWFIVQVHRTLLKHIPSGWRNNQNSLAKKIIAFNDNQNVVVQYKYLKATSSSSHQFHVEIDNEKFTVELVNVSDNSEYTLMVNGVQNKFVIVGSSSGHIHIHSSSFGSFVVQKKSLLASADDQEDEIEGDVISPMPARVLELLVKDGDIVGEGEALVVVESMKMQNTHKAPVAGKVKVFIKVGDLVEAGSVMMSIETVE